jgi:hypothetical protein
MTTRIALTMYLLLWAAIAAAAIWGMASAGFPLWVAVVLVFLLFWFLNGTLAYRAKARQLRGEGKEPPGYVRYLLIPAGVPKFREQAPRSMHGLVGIAAFATGAFFWFCGGWLALTAQWGRISDPMVVGVFCLVLVGMGTTFLYLAWRLFVASRRKDDAA